MDKQFVIPVRVDERILNKLNFVSIKLQQGRSETIGKGLERLYSELGRKISGKGLIWAHIWLGVAISVLALYTYTIIYIFNHDMEEIFATFIMLVIYSLFFLLFLISVGGLSLLVCVELAYRNLQRYKKIKKSLLFDSTFTNKSLSNIIEL